jgi:tripartite-type tricarboxylate transporter receptor subunit TctC
VFGSVTASMPLVRAAKLRALAVTGLARSNLAPELPTLHESGFPGFNVTAWQSMVVPAGTPRGIVMRMHGEIIKALAMPEVTRLFHNIGYEITGTTPEKLAEIIRDESRLWARVIREANIRPE